MLFGPAYKGIPLSVVTAIASANYMARRSATAQTEKKKRTMAQIREASLEANFRMETAL